jgi:hypothetical protein
VENLVPRRVELLGGADQAPWRVSRWLRIDLPSKVRALGKPVLHVTATDAGEAGNELATAA